MADFFHLNLWMLIVFGILGYALCYFRYKLAYWVMPGVLLVCIAFVFGVLPGNLPVLRGLEPLTWVRIGFSIFIAIVLPVAGALADYENRKPRRTGMP